LEHPRLSVLNLQYNHVSFLKNLSKKLLKSSKLKTLNLKHNGIQSFPIELCELSLLRVLVLSDNLLIEIPQEIETLANLRELHLSNCGITAGRIAPAVKSLLHLSTLDLSWNALTELPKEIGQLQLREIYLQHNKLNPFPTSVLGITTLSKLSIADNDFRSVPPEISHLKSLQYLNLSQNRLEGLPKEMGSLNELQILHLEYNYITHLPQELIHLTRLHTLHLHHNELIQIPLPLLDVQFVQQLIVLSLDFNNFDKVIAAHCRRYGSLGFLKSDDIDEVLNAISGSNSTPNLKKKPSNFKLSRSMSSTKMRSGSGSQKDLASPSSGGSLTSPLGSQGGTGIRAPSIMECPSSFTKFKHAWESLLAEQHFSQKLLKEFADYSNEQKWEMLVQYKPQAHLELLREDYESGFTAEIISSGRETSSGSGRNTLSRKGSMKWKLSLRASKKTAPEVDDIMQLINKQVTTQELHSINNALGIAPAWSAAFIEAGGLHALLGTLSKFHARTKLKSYDIELYLEILSCIENILNVDVFGVLLHKHLLEILVASLMNDKVSHRIHQAVIDLMYRISSLSLSSLGLLSGAFDNVSRQQVTTTFRFDVLLKLISSHEIPTALRVSSLSFVNGLISSADDLVTRNTVRNEFLHHGFKKIIQDLKSERLEEFENLIETFESDLADDYQDLMYLAQENSDFLNSSFEGMQDVKLFVEQQEEETKEKIEKDEIKDLLKVYFINSATKNPRASSSGNYIPIPYTPKTAVSQVMHQVLAKLAIDPQAQNDYGIYLPTVARKSSVTLQQSDDNNTNENSASYKSPTKHFLSDSLSFTPKEKEKVTSNPLLAMKRHRTRSRSTSAPSSPMLGVWLTADKTLGDYKLSGQIVCELKLKPWTIKVDVTVEDVKASTSVSIDPFQSVANFIKNVMKKYPGAQEDYGIVLPIVLDESNPNFQDFHEEIKTSEGLWLLETRVLVDYQAQFRQSEYFCYLKMKPRVLNIRLGVTDAVQRLYFDPSKSIQHIKEQLVKQMLSLHVSTPAPSATPSPTSSPPSSLPSSLSSDSPLSSLAQVPVASSFFGNRNLNPHDYALYVEYKEFPVDGYFLQDDHLLQDYDINDSMCVRIKLKPQNFKMLIPTEQDGEWKEISYLVDVTKTPAEILQEICFKYNLEVSYFNLVLAKDKKGPVVKLNPDQPLNNQLHARYFSWILLKRMDEVYVEEEQTEVSEDDIPIWEDSRKDTAQHEEGKLIAASLNRLILILTSTEDYDTAFLNTFLMTYQAFITPEKLLKKLIERYRVPSNSNISDKTKSTIQLRVCVFLKHWIEKGFKQLLSSNNGAVLKEIYDFIQQDIQDTSLNKMVDPLMKTISDAMTVQPDVNVLVIPDPDMKIVKRLNFVDVDENIIAKHLCIESFNIFCKIKPNEFFNQAWNNPKYQHNARNLLSLVEQFNSVSKWVASGIVLQDKIRKRTKLLQAFIRIAKCLRDMNNFHLLMAFISGMNNAAVSRLKWTKERLPKTSKQVWESLEHDMQLTGAFKNYRALLTSATPPCIPYIGVHLQDLVFIEDGNPDTVGPQKLINWRKCTYYADIIRLIQRFQDTAYSTDLPNHKEFQQLFSQQPQLSDKDLWNRSLKCEPRNATRAEIQ